ncbi:hypothetical protein [Klebsiella phage vB_KpnM_TU02]|uniref:Uncharacterized protein n=1 Tax=Klebsiella phage PMBT63 TaxID=3229739 RepID=A0AB39C3S0_9CAUD|nr:hypothetical protein [Klebsiella phage vB_KpnM_TU02]
MFPRNKLYIRKIISLACSTSSYLLVLQEPG